MKPDHKERGALENQDQRATEGQKVCLVFQVSLERTESRDKRGMLACWGQGDLTGLLVEVHLE